MNPDTYYTTKTDNIIFYGHNVKRVPRNIKGKFLLKFPRGTDRESSLFSLLFSCFRKDFVGNGNLPCPGYLVHTIVQFRVYSFEAFALNQLYPSTCSCLNVSPRTNFVCLLILRHPVTSVNCTSVIMAILVASGLT